MAEPAAIEPPPLPAAVIDLARRLGADPATAAGRHVEMRQHGWLRQTPNGIRLAFRARQSIALAEPGFAWIAHCGPLGALRVRDFLEGADGGGTVALFGLPLARSPGTPQIMKGEMMRYLAELIWAPDAILLNRRLAWREVDARTLAVAAGKGATRGEVMFHLDENGKVEAVGAAGRPRQEGKGFTERPWWGRVGDYRRQHGRLVPMRAEVGWALDGREFHAWHGELADWRLA